jgi:hypothetical protein
VWRIGGGETFRPPRGIDGTGLLRAGAAMVQPRRGSSVTGRGDTRSLAGKRGSDILMRHSAGARLRVIGALTVALAMPIGAANAQHTVRLLTPTSDTCRAFTQALGNHDLVTAEAMGTWAVGYISGVAEGTGINFLERASVDEIFRQLQLDCHDQPRMQFSTVVSALARSLLAGYHR